MSSQPWNQNLLLYVICVIRRYRMNLGGGIPAGALREPCVDRHNLQLPDLWSSLLPANRHWMDHDGSRIGREFVSHIYLTAFFFEGVIPLCSTFLYGHCSWWLNFFPHQIDPVDPTELLASFVWCIGLKDNSYLISAYHWLSLWVVFFLNWE